MNILMLGWAVNLLTIVFIFSYEKLIKRYDSERDFFPLMGLLAMSLVPYFVFLVATIGTIKDKIEQAMKEPKP